MAGRVGIVGFSRTCFYTMAALASGAIPFRAATITDGFNYGYWQYLAYTDSYGDLNARDAEAILGARPFGSGLSKWIERSPEFNLANVSAPLQVVALGRTSLISMWEPYAALRHLNKPVDLIVLPNDSTHVLTNPGQRVTSQGGTIDWFRFWLQGYEDPDPSKREQYVRWAKLRALQGNRPRPSIH